MAFLRVQDYYIRIAKQHLDQILAQAQGLTGDPEVRQGSEITAIAYIRGQLTQRFKVDKIFTDLLLFSIGASYKWGDLIDFTAPVYNALNVYVLNDTVLYTDGNIYYRNSTTAGYTAGVLPTNGSFFVFAGTPSLYYVTPPPTFDEDVTYTAGQYVVYNYEYYKRTTDTNGYKVDGRRDSQANTLYNQWADIGFPQAYTNVPTSNVVDPYGNAMTPENPQYWTKIIDFSNNLITGVWPSDSTKWTHGDNRNQLIIKAVIDLALVEVHGVINPNQIPSLRGDRAKQTIDWLKECAKGEYTLEVPFYTEDSNRGYPMRFGSNPQTSHSY